MRVLVFAPSFDRSVKAGGPARSLTNLVRSLGDEFVVDVVTPDRDLGDLVPFAGLSGMVVRRGHSTVYFLDQSSPRQVVSLVRRISRVPYDLIMLNGVWNHRLALFPAVLKVLEVLDGPVLLMPHGELEPGALAIKAAKKKLAGPVYRKIYRHAVSVWGATSDEEAANISAWLQANARVLTTRNNGSDSIPWGKPDGPSAALRVLFLSRISSKKGLLFLLRGLEYVRQPIVLSIAGPIEDAAYWARCQAAIGLLPDHVVVHYSGVVGRSEIASVLWNSDCMVLPTAGENYGHVIAEALQAGCPVITTATTPWTDVLRRGGGEIIAQREDAISIAGILDSWAAKDPGELKEARLSALQAFKAYNAEADRNIIELATQNLYNS